MCRTASSSSAKTAAAFETIFRKVVKLLASRLEQGAFTFGDIRETVLGRPSLVARLFGKEW